MSTFDVNGHTYTTDHYGVIHQLHVDSIQYDRAYVEQHRSKPKYAARCKALSMMRMGMVVETVGGIPKSLLDYGYGDGQFLMMADHFCDRTFGLDPAGWPISSLRVTNPVPAKVYTMWDVLEHLPDLEILETLPTSLLVVSVPDAEGEDLSRWKHLRPNEHLHHFTPHTLQLFMQSIGWRQLWFGHPEDVIRGGPRNILSAGFSRD